jgi:hypothetical protein
MLLALLLILNLPVFLFVGWIVFDTKDDAAETAKIGIIELLMEMVCLLTSRFRWWGDSEVSGSAYTMLGFFVACTLIVSVEIYFINKFYGLSYNAWMF